MYKKYTNSIPGTKEYIFYTFFAAYITQDIESLEEGIEDFKNTSTSEAKKKLVLAIEDFLSLDFPADEKFSFIEDLSSGWIEKNTAKEQLLSIRSIFKK